MSISLGVVPQTYVPAFRKWGGKSLWPALATEWRPYLKRGGGLIRCLSV